MRDKKVVPAPSPLRSKAGFLPASLRPGSDVLLFSEEPELLEIKGRLVEIKDAGFCVAHHQPGLQAGQRLQIAQPGLRMRVPVAWARLLNRSTETVFLTADW